MSNIAGSDSEKSIILYFFLFTAIFYVGAYLSLDYFGYTMGDIPENGNIITPLLESVLDQLVSFIDWFVEFFTTEDDSWWNILFSSIPIIGDLTLGIQSILTSLVNALGALVEQFKDFINVWNILNIYIFYILFIPYALITVLIIYELIIRLVEGLIP